MVAKGYSISGVEFFSVASLRDAVYGDDTGANEIFGLATSGCKIFEFDKCVEFNVGVG